MYREMYKMDRMLMQSGLFNVDPQEKQETHLLFKKYLFIADYVPLCDPILMEFA